MLVGKNSKGNTMEIIKQRTWVDVKKEIEEIQAKAKNKKSSLFFRGLRDESWKLETTLERASCKEEYAVCDYLRDVWTGMNELQSFTGKRWDLERFKDAFSKIQENDNPHKVPFLKDDDLMSCLIYLRHHGFPSPLLDWTKSPYIAAFFAYENLKQEKDAAIFYYEYDPLASNTTVLGYPMLSDYGSQVTTHPRHFVQQAHYTIVVTWKREINDYVFSPHRNEIPEKKIILPFKERTRALTELNLYNINYFTLFQTEDALVKTMAMKRFDLGL